MDWNELRSLEMRVACLERETRRWKLLSVAALAALAVMVLAGHTSPSAVAKGIEPKPLGPSLAPPRIIEAQEFVLRDGSGAKRATLGLSGEGLPLLAFFGEGEEARAVLGPRYLSLSGDAGQAALKLLVSPEGRPALRLERDGRLRAVLGMTSDETVVLGFYNQDGQGRAVLDVGVDGSPGLTLFSRTGKIAWSAP